MFDCRRVSTRWRDRRETRRVKGRGTYLSIRSVRYTSCASNSVCVMARDTIGVCHAEEVVSGDMLGGDEAYGMGIEEEDLHA